jgi:hypothetical protein
VRRQTLFFPAPFFIVLLFMAVFVGERPAGAQNPTQDAAAAPALELSTAQRQTVFQSVSKTQKNHAAPTGFRVSVGAHVPDAIELAAMPDTLATLIPEARGFSVAMVEKQVMIVDRNSRQVVAVVTEAH